MSVPVSQEGNENENNTKEVPSKFLIGGTPVYENKPPYSGVPLQSSTLNSHGAQSSLMPSNAKPT